MFNHTLKSGKVLVWDATCPDTCAPSHIPTTATQAGAAAAQAEGLKLAKYAYLDSIYFFAPFAVETSGVLERQLRILWESWDGNSARPQENPSVNSTFCSAIPLPCREEMQLQSSAPREGHSYRAGSDCLHGFRFFYYYYIRRCWLYSPVVRHSRELYVLYD